MTDALLKSVIAALLFAGFVMFCLLVWGITYAALDDAEYQCRGTGRQVLTMMPAGKVMVPIMQEETVCKRVEK